MNANAQDCKAVDDWILRCVGRPLALKLARMGIETVENLPNREDLLEKLYAQGFFYDPESQAIRLFQ